MRNSGTLSYLDNIVRAASESASKNVPHTLYHPDEPLIWNKRLLQALPKQSADRYWSKVEHLDTTVDVDHLNLEKDTFEKLIKFAEQGDAEGFSVGVTFCDGILSVWKRVP